MLAEVLSHLELSAQNARGFDLVLGTLLCWAGYVLLKVCYRLWFHPLSRFPGPKIAAATSCFEFYYSVIQDGMFPWKIKELHEKYGPVVRITPNELHFSDPEFHNQIYTGQSNPRDKYAPFYRFTGATHSAFETHESKLHNSRRQPLQSAFSKKAVNSLEPLIRRKIKYLSQRVEEARVQGTPIVLDSAFSALTADIISEYGFGHCLDYLKDANFKNDIRDSLFASLSLFHIVRFFPAIMGLAKVLPYSLVQRLNPHLSKVLGFRQLIRSMAVEEIGKMDKGLPSDAILVKALNDPSIPVTERSLERICDEGFVFLNAGVTAGKTLAFTMYQLLANNQDAYKKLHAELKAAFPDVKAIDDVPQKDLEALPYLRAVIYESLRVSIGPLTRLPRVAPAKPLVFQDWVIPPGTGISESNYFLHMNPELFPEPTKFRPERWIEAEAKGQRLQNYIVTFSKGTRHCLGMSLAYVELYMTVASLVRRFGMDLYETTDSDVEVFRDRLFGYPNRPSKGVRVIPTAVKA